MLKEHRPELVARDCNHCLKYLYYEEGPKEGQVVLHPDEPGGQPVLRAWHKPAPCRHPNKTCPKGTPENPNTLSEQNLQCLIYHRRCELTGRWPEDEILIQNGILIRETERRSNEQKLKDAIAEGMDAAIGSLLVVLNSR